MLSCAIAACWFTESIDVCLRMEYHLCKPSLDQTDFAFVDRVIRQTMESHGLRYRIENAEDGIHVLLVHPDSANSWQAKDSEGTAALLTAYLQHLESLQEVAV